jgi:hypothetical protein
MQDHDRLTPGEREMEAAWRDLTPSVLSLNRDQVMFQAGRASTSRQNRLWQAVSSSLAVLLLVSIVSRPTPHQPTMMPDNLAQGLQNGGTTDDSQWVHQQLQPFRDYVHTRGRLLEYGLNYLPAARPAHTEGKEPPLNRDHLDDIFSSI